MTKFYINLSNDTLSSLITSYLQGSASLDIFTEKNLNKLITDISIIGAPDIIITDSLETLNSTHLDKSYIYYISDSSDDISHDKVFKTSQWNELCELIKSKYVLNYNEMDYCEVSIFLLTHIEKSICDIFIKIKKNNNDHLIKLINKNEYVDQNSIYKYIDKGVRSVSISSKEKNLFLITISNMLQDKLSSEGSVNIVGKAMDATVNILKEIGFNFTTNQLIEDVLYSLNKSLESTDDDDLVKIKDLLDSQTTRFFKKTHLISFLSTKVLGEIEWATVKHKQAMICLSMFCDICLSKEKMLYILNNEQLKNSTLTQEEKDLVTFHARDASKLIEAYTERPFGVETLILEHHGDSSGVGLNDSISSDMNKLIIIFRVCEDFSIELLKLKDLNKDVKLLDIFQFLYIKHNTKHVHVYIDLLKKCFID